MAAFCLPASTVAATASTASAAVEAPGIKCSVKCTGHKWEGKKWKKTSLFSVGIQDSEKLAAGGSQKSFWCWCCFVNLPIATICKAQSHSAADLAAALADWASIFFILYSKISKLEKVMLSLFASVFANKVGDCFLKIKRNNDDDLNKGSIFYRPNLLKIFFYHAYQHFLPKLASHIA